MSRPLITLLTDFGHRDPYVGIMKGQILKLCPGATLVDLTHEVPPQDIRAASFHLEQSIGSFPDGTVHLAVVDPGVGTSRAMIAVRTRRALFVAPDNGLLTRALRRAGTIEIVEIPTPPQASSTFHGRDVMGPAAALLATGLPLSLLGPSRTDYHRLQDPPATVSPQKIETSVLIVDHFGNVIFDLPKSRAASLLLPNSLWHLKSREIKMGQTYRDAPPQGSLLLWSSHDMLELARREGRADQEWELKPGDQVELRPSAGSDDGVG